MAGGEVSLSLHRLQYEKWSAASDEKLEGETGNKTYQLWQVEEAVAPLAAEVENSAHQLECARQDGPKVLLPVPIPIPLDQVLVPVTDKVNTMIEVPYSSCYK